MFSSMVDVRKCFIVDTGHHFINTVQLSNETYILTHEMWPAKNTCRVNCRLKAPLLVIYNTPQSPVNKKIHAIITPPPPLGCKPSCLQMHWKMNFQIYASTASCFSRNSNPLDLTCYLPLSRFLSDSPDLSWNWENKGKNCLCMYVYINFI